MKKFLCLALVLLLLLPMTIACKKDKQDDGGNTGDVAGESSSSGSESEGGEEDDEEEAKKKYNFGILKDLPQADYDGKVFNVSMEDSSDQIGNFNAEKINGSDQNDALYKWLTKVETHFNFDVKVSANNGDGATYAKNIVTEIQGTSDAYYLYGIRAFQSWQGAVAGCFIDWRSLNTEWIDLDDAKRWDVETNDAVTFNGKFYTATGDLGASKLKNTMATFYHVELLERFGAANDIDQDYIYGLVKSGDWTLENMETIVKDVWADGNGDGIKNVGDTFGYYSNSGNSYDIWAPAMGIVAIEETDDGIEAVLSRTTNTTKLARVRDFYHNNQGVMPSSNGTGDTYYAGTSGVGAFLNSNSLFITDTFSAAYDSFRTIGTDAYGMMPQPKYDEHQDYYMSYINDNYTVWALNTNIKHGEERDFAAHMTDALCAESANSLYYEFYDVMLKKKYSKDAATREMVDKIMENVMCDATRQFGNYLAGEGGVEGYTGAVRSYLRNPDYDLNTNLMAYEQQINSPGGSLEKMFGFYQ